MTKFFGTFFRVNFDQFCYVKKSSYLCIVIKNNSIHMTDKQKQAILAITRAKEERTMEEEDYLLLMEFIMDTQRSQYVPYVPYPIDTPTLPKYPWEGPWVTYQTTCTTSLKTPSNEGK